MEDVKVEQPQTFLKPAHTERQGQFLDYIHQYSILIGCAPTEADIRLYCALPNSTGAQCETCRPAR
jgi:hypothetical protein